MEKELLRSIARLKKSKAGSLVATRMKEFRVARGSHADIFSELCFCILTANYTAEGGIRIQKDLHKKFHKLTKAQLAKKLSSLGHRFPNTRAKFIYLAKAHKGKLGHLLRTCDSRTMREWLVENVMGLGYKEASHFLRNTGATDLAIIDFHILGILARNKLIKKPKTKSNSLSKKSYLETERVLEKLASKAGITLAELDLYLWYMETGKILK